MNILECIKQGNGLGYRESFPSWRGSSGDGFRDIRFMLEVMLFDRSGVHSYLHKAAPRAYLTWDDLLAEDWIPKKV